MLEKLENTRWKYLLFGAIVFVIGLCFLFLQGSLNALTVLVGIIVALCGVALGSLCILGKKRGFAFAVRVSTAAVLFISGVLALAFNSSSFEVLVSGICLLITVDASFKLFISIKSKINSVNGWWIMTAISAAVILSAFLLIRILPDSTRASAIWLGITMLADASNNFLAAISTVRCKTAEKAAIYYEVYRDIEASK